MTRGRLIEPFVIEIAQLDTKATEDGGGYDPAWKTVRTTYVNGVRTKGQVYKSPRLRVRAQVEPQTHKQQQQAASGNAPVTKYIFVVHFAELERLSLIDPRGEPMIRVNDRVMGVYLRKTEALVQLFDPGLYITEAQNGGFGLGGRRNLLLLNASDRAQGIRA